MSTSRNPKRIDNTKLTFSFYDLSKDDFSLLNFKQKDGSDPLGTDKFIHDGPFEHIKNNIYKIYSIRYEDQLTAFFAVSMSQIQLRCHYDIDQVPNTRCDLYPALFVSHIGIDRNFKGQGMGYSIILYCLGLGQVLKEKVGCSFLLLRTTKKLAEKYYGPRYSFKWGSNSQENIWMYRKLF